jgi:hypothetical protein
MSAKEFVKRYPLLAKFALIKPDSVRAYVRPNSYDEKFFPFGKTAYRGNINWDNARPDLPLQMRALLRIQASENPLLKLLTNFHERLLIAAKKELDREALSKLES